MLRDLAAQEFDAAAELLDAVDPVLDADPTVEPDAGELGEDRVVVVHALADLSLPQPRAGTGAVLLAPRVLDGPLGEVPVAGVHRPDAVLYPTEQFQRIL